jgi:NDP-sugar pyrophosphorylase family protein
MAVLQVDKSIIGWDSTIGAWSRLENHCVLGEDVQVKVSGLAAVAAVADMVYCASRRTSAAGGYCH